MSEPIPPKPRRRSDLGASLTGLVVGAVVLFALLFSIVKLTNAKYAGHEAGAPAASHSAPAATAPAAPPPAGIRADDTSHAGH